MKRPHLHLATTRQGDVSRVSWAAIVTIIAGIVGVGSGIAAKGAGQAAGRAAAAVVAHDSALRTFETCTRGNVVKADRIITAQDGGHSEEIQRVKRIFPLLDCDLTAQRPGHPHLLAHAQVWRFIDYVRQSREPVVIHGLVAGSRPFPSSRR